MKKYYFNNGSEQEGPFSFEELKSKNIKRETEIWFEGLSDWTVADKVDELKELFVLTSPPPIKKKTTATPPPIIKTKTENKEVKKPFSWTKILIIVVILSVVAYGGMEIYKDYSMSSSAYDNNYSTGSYQDKKMTVAEIERSRPTDFLSADGTYRENLLGDKLKVDGVIRNSATAVSYKDATVRVTYYSKTKTNLGSEDYTIWEVFPPNHTKNFQLKIKNYSNVKSIGWEVIDADVY